LEFILPYNQSIFPFGIPAKESLEHVTGSFTQAYPVEEARCFDDLMIAIDAADVGSERGSNESLTSV
jgi:hypothetical protein